MRDRTLLRRLSTVQSTTQPDDHVPLGAISNGRRVPANGRYSFGEGDYYYYYPSELHVAALKAMQRSLTLALQFHFAGHTNSLPDAIVGLGLFAHQISLLLFVAVPLQYIILNLVYLALLTIEFP